MTSGGISQSKKKKQIKKTKKNNKKWKILVEKTRVLCYSTFVLFFVYTSKNRKNVRKNSEIILTRKNKYTKIYTENEQSFEWEEIV